MPKGFDPLGQGVGSDGVATGTQEIGDAGRVANGRRPDFQPVTACHTSLRSAPPGLSGGVRVMGEGYG